MAQRSSCGRCALTIPAALVLGCLTALMLVAPASALTSPAPLVVVIGAPGLRWQDITTDTPALRALAEQGGIAQMSVRSVYRVTCPVDGWLTLSSARRAAAERVPGLDETTNAASLNEFCPPPPTVTGGSLSDWQPLVDYNAGLSFDAPLGQLGDDLQSQGICATPVGDGAAVALARSDGTVSRFVPTPAGLTRTAVTACPLTVVDAGTVNVRRGRSDRAAQVAAIDAAVGQVMTVVPAGSVVLLASLANAEPTATLQVLAASGPSYAPGLLTTSSTRQPGVALLTDLTPTVYALVGLAPAQDFVGSPLVDLPSTISYPQRRSTLLFYDRKIVVYGQVAQPFFTALVPLQLVLYLASAWAIRRRSGDPSGRRRVLRGTGFLALVCASIPVSTFLANLMPWWTWPSPHLSLVALVLAWACVVAAVAQVGRRFSGILGEACVVAAITALVLAVDVMGNDTLQTGSLLGYSPVVGGRFYGLGNVAFALFATGAIMGVGFGVDAWVRHGRRRAAVIAVAVVGVAATLIDGLPRYGADFGGMLAMVIGFGALMFGVLEMRVTVKRIIGLLAVGVVVVSTVAFLDWLRPPAQQTHLGRFVQQVLDGQLIDIVTRKLGNNLNVLGSSVLGLLVPLAVAFLLLVLLRQTSPPAPVLRTAFLQAPMLRPTLTAWLTAMVAGFAVNDSGVVIPAIGIMLAVPLVIGISTRVLEAPVEVPVDADPA